MSLKYRTSAGTSASNFSDLVVKVGDTLPIGTEVDYDGQTAPAGWQEVDDPNVYSTTETKVGTWINGKPLYRKVFTGTTDGTSALTISTGSGTYIRTFDGTINSNYNNRWKVPNIYSETQYNVGAFIMTNNYELRLALGSAFQASGLGYVVAIEYTKTTD